MKRNFLSYWRSWMLAQNYLHFAATPILGGIYFFSNCGIIQVESKKIYPKKETKMKLNIKSIGFKVWVVLFICSTLSTMAYSSPYFVGNWAERAFDGTGNSQTVVLSETLESYIIAGAGNILNGYSAYLQLLNRVEMATEPSTLDYNECVSMINRSIERINNARNAYVNLLAQSLNNPYNQMFIDRLVTFDFALFKKERALYGNTMDRVQQLLGKGDVRGLFAQLLTGTESILSLLNKIKASVDSGSFPEMSSLWRTNQAFSETMLLGQYAAEIFFAVSK